MPQLRNERSPAAYATEAYEAPSAAARTPSSPPTPKTPRWPLPAATLLEAIEATRDDVLGPDASGIRERGLEPQTMRDPR
ncbi:MAG: hypothetical protein AAF447_16460 [Myxococcota bacterium]